MKRLITAMVLALCSLALLSCGQGKKEAPGPSPSAAASTPAPAPEMDIDDSLSFYAQYDRESLSPLAPIKEAFTAAYKERMGPYVENLSVSEFRLTQPLLDETMYVGCFVLTGTPAEALGWERADSYCRSFNLRSEDLENWSFAKSYPMEPGEYLAYTLYNDDHSLCKYASPVVAGLSSAKLYVSQLGESYTLTDADALDELARSLSIEWLGDWDFPATVLDRACEFVNPLYLYLDDGSTKLVLTAGDGSNACYIWDLWRPYNTGKSIFEQFGVPLEAAGYERGGGLTKTTVSFAYGSRYPDDEAGYEGSEQRIYDENGRLVQLRKYWDEAMPVGGGTTRSLTALKYDGGGRLAERAEYSNDILYTTFVYEYDAQGLLVRRTTVFSDAVSGVESGPGVISDYTYDGQNRITEIKSHYPHDEGGPSASYCPFWYDADGFRHMYAYDDSGNLIGHGDEPLRREG